MLYSHLHRVVNIFSSGGRRTSAIQCAFKMQLPVSAFSSETLFLVFAEKIFPLLPNVYPKPWDVHTKAWNICTKSWDIHPRLWDINRTTQKKEFSRYFERVYAQWAKCSTTKAVNACVFIKFHTHFAPYFDTTF